VVFPVNTNEIKKGVNIEKYYNNYKRVNKPDL